jgi:hypothetical protein
VGCDFQFNVTTSGYPFPDLAHSALPDGLVWTSNGNGTATISGVPEAAGTTGVLLTASNVSGSTWQVLTIEAQPATPPNSNPPRVRTHGRHHW